MRRFTVLSVLLLTAAVVFAQPTKVGRDLVGIWQFSSMIAAGWNENFQFFANGKVVHNTNQMDYYKRLRSEWGTWKLSGNSITVRYTHERVLVGGKRIPERDLPDADFGYDGYKIVERALKSPRTKTFKVSGMHMQSKPYPTAMLGGRKAWKMKDDPKDYQ